MINGILIEKTEESQTTALRQIEAEDLPEGDVLVDIAWSTLNYKDALAITGSSPVVRKFPMVPGIDFAGDDWVSGQLTFTLPLWSEQRQKPALRQAEASRSEAMMALQFAAREAVATYQSEQAVWQTAEQSLKVLATQRLAIKDEIAAQTANYEAGRGGYAAMVDGAIALLKLDAEIAALRAQREMAIARMNALLVTP